MQMHAALAASTQPHLRVGEKFHPRILLGWFLFLCVCVCVSVCVCDFPLQELEVRVNQVKRMEP